MQITYMSQRVAESLEIGQDEAIISITEPGYRAVLTLSDPLSVLRLEFDDHDPQDNSNALMPAEIYDLSDYRLFDEAHAKKIMDFVESNIGVKRLYVHCHAGISRSRAVVMALREHFDMDMNPSTQWNTANKHVYRVLTQYITGHKVGSSFGELEE